MSWQYTKDLVSILTPCYNTGSIVHRLLDSILMQDYEHVEMIAVNDGSTDNTEEVLLSYKPRFEQKGYSFRYIYQENGGQSSAINNGLKFVTGEFLTWPDSDDYYHSSSALSRLKKEFDILSADFAIVRALPVFVDEMTLRELHRPVISDSLSNTSQFQNCLYSQSFIWPPGNYLIRQSCFDSVVKDREIYTEKRAGQNWQMLLPLCYSFKCRTIDVYLFSVLVRSSSHSRVDSNRYEHVIERNLCYKRTILNTLDRMVRLSESERMKYRTGIETQYAIKEYEFAVLFGHGKEAGAIKKSLSRKGVKIPLTRTLKLYLYSSRLFAQLQRFRHRFK